LFNSQQELKMYFFSEAFRPALEPTLSPIQCTSRAISPEAKQPGPEAEHVPPSNTAVKNHCTVLPLRFSLRGFAQGQIYLHNNSDGKVMGCATDCALDVWEGQGCFFSVLYQFRVCSSYSFVTTERRGCLGGVNRTKREAGCSFP